MLIVDYREHHIIDILNEKNIKYEEQNLHLGDFLIHDSLLIERKTMDDLSASITDGRYHEQKARLLQTHFQVLILIEGVKTNKSGIPQKTLTNVMLKLALRDGFHVLRTSSMHETAEILALLSEHYPYKEHQSTSQPVLPLPKKMHAHSYTCMLCCIQGVSKMLAKRIQEKFPTMHEFVTNATIDNLRTIDKIGPKLAEKIINAVHSSATD